jgi:hypothetical protein
MAALPTPPGYPLAPVLAAQERDDALQTFPPGALESRVSERYGEAGNAGWSPIPDVLLFNQHRLGIQSDDLIVLLNLMAHYYVRDEMPFTRPTTIAKRVGVSQRSVQRSIARLLKLGVIEVPPEQQHQSRPSGWAFRVGKVRKGLKLGNRTLPLALEHLQIDVVLVTTFGTHEGVRMDNPLLPVILYDIRRCIMAYHVYIATGHSAPTENRYDPPGYPR